MDYERPIILRITKSDNMKIKIRPETRSDIKAIGQVNDLAFGQADEGLIVEKLRRNPAFVKELSFVALFNGEVVGHILFFPVSIRGEHAASPSLALAPMSVLPELQNMGIGGQMVKAGLEAAKQLGFKSVIVLGHKEYYPRFGFVPASRYGIKAPFDVPDEAFMALELQPGGLSDVSGTVQYPPELLPF
jgi:predicted N-acetyltransferase YhbS